MIFYLVLFKVIGVSEKVQIAKEAILGMIRSHSENNHIMRINIPLAAFPLVIGKKGVVIQDIQALSGVKKIDANRDQEELVIRGK